MPPAEQVILVAAWAIRASQAANKKHRNAHRHHNGQDASTRRKPMNQAMHNQDSKQST